MDSNLDLIVFWARISGVMKGLLDLMGHVTCFKGACLSISVDKVELKRWRYDSSVPGGLEWRSEANISFEKEEIFILLYARMHFVMSGDLEWLGTVMVA
jgi:hypothetical protein